MVTFVRLIRNTDFNCGDFINSIKIEWVLQFFLFDMFIYFISQKLNEKYIISPRMSC